MSSWANTNAANRLPGELDELVEVDRPGLKLLIPRLDIGDVLETAHDRLEQLGLLGRRPEEMRGLLIATHDDAHAHTPRGGATQRALP